MGETACATAPATRPHQARVSTPVREAGEYRLLRDAFGSFPSGVTALAAVIDGQPVGIAASSFTSVSLEPALVSVCVALTSSTWPVLSRATHLGVSVLGEDHHEAGRRLASKNGDRFHGLNWRATDEGAILLGDASAWFTTTVHQRVTAGDHEIVVLAVEDFARNAHVAPLVFHDSEFRRLSSRRLQR